MSTMMSLVNRLAELFDSEGAGDYLGEPVTVAQHLLQAAALAAAAAAPPALVGAALLRWDDLAKDPSAAVPEFPHYRQLLEGLPTPAS